MSSLPLVPAAAVDLVFTCDTRELLATFLNRRSPHTRRAYGRDLDDFTAFVGAESRVAAVSGLLRRSPGSANAIGLHYKASLQERGLSPATVNRRLSSLRSVVSLARLVGLVNWRLEVPGESVQPYRDTRGPSLAGVELLLRAIEGDDLKGRRDRAILRLLWDWALRRGEVAALDVGDVELTEGRLGIVGKGRTQREWIELPDSTVRVLESYLAARPDVQPDDPLFISLDRAHPRNRISGAAIYDLVARLAKRAGLPGPVSPHRLRHAAITLALDRTGGDVRAVRAFSRHARVETVLRYDDRRRDCGGKVASLVAASL